MNETLNFLSIRQRDGDCVFSFLRAGNYMTTQQLLYPVLCCVHIQILTIGEMADRFCWKTIAYGDSAFLYCDVIEPGEKPEYYHENNSRHTELEIGNAVRNQVY